MKMRRVVLVIAVACAMSVGGWCQDGLLPDLGDAFSGTSAMAYVLDTGSFDGVLSAAGYPPFPGILLMVGQTTALPITDRLVVGFSVCAGTFNDSAGARRVDADLSLSVGLAEVAVFAWNSGSISLGLGLGLGDAAVGLIDRIPASVNDALAQPNRVLLERTLYVAEPAVAVVLIPTPSVKLRLRLGYCIAFSDHWNLEGQDVPDPSPGTRGPFAEISAGVDWELLFGWIFEGPEEREISPEGGGS